MRVAVVMKTYYLGVSISVIETIKSLVKAGASVDVFITEAAFRAAPAHFDSPLVEVVVIPDQPMNRPRDRRVDSFIAKIILGLEAYQYWLLPMFGLWGGVCRYLRAYLQRHPFLDGMKERMTSTFYDVIVGVEAGGLVAGACAVDLWHPRARLIYYNMELRQHERNLIHNRHIEKHLEISCSRCCEFIVIPDKERGEVFARANRVDPVKLRYLPISTAGPPVTSRTRLLQERFGLSADALVVLYAGNIHSVWAMGREVVESVRSWPDRCVLVMHSWKPGVAEDMNFKQIMREADPARVFFSLTPLEPDELPAMMSSAHVGLAFYKPVDENFREVGASSNKLAQYARVGLPVVANRLPSIERVFQRFGGGVCVESTRDIGKALEVILSRYDQFHRGAFESYRGLYDFSEHFSPILQEIMDLESVCKGSPSIRLPSRAMSRL